MWTTVLTSPPRYPRVIFFQFLMVLSIFCLPKIGYTDNTPLEFEADLERVTKEIQDPSLFNATNCHQYLQQNTEFLLAKGVQTYLPKNELEKQRLIRSAPDILQHMFQLRLLIHEKTKAFYFNDNVTPSCIAKTRLTLRYSRFIEEFIGEWLIQNSGEKPSKTAFQGSSPASFLNPQFEQLKFQSGDILLIRSHSFVSATIARIGDEDGQFSHAALVYVPDPKAPPMVIESTAQHGVSIHPLKDVLDSHAPRILVYRHSDSAMAASAAQKMATFVQQKENQGEIIAYDFHLDLNSSETYFCTELVQTAFIMAGSLPTDLPIFPTSMAIFEDHVFLKQMGIRSLVTFAPSDIEVDPYLTLIAEWRNLELTGKTRLQDAILTSVLDWMARSKYELTFKGPNKYGANITWALLKPAGLFSDRIPKNMDRTFMKSLFSLLSITRALEKAVKREKVDAYSDGIVIDYRHMLASLESIRQKDCQRYREYRDWQSGPADDAEPKSELFHHLLNVPDSVGGCPLTDQSASHHEASNPND